MFYLGVDIGSSSSKAVIVDDKKEIISSRVLNIGTGSRGPKEVVRLVLEEAGISESDIAKCVATGYGRISFQNADKQVTEISCHAKGVAHLVPNATTIIDIGGQDAKVIRINNVSGVVENFVMNEKCAAGTGRFLEVVSRVLDCNLSELSELAASGKAGVTISSVCTVFAESEMISQLSAGKKTEDVAYGALQSVSSRVIGLANRIGVVPGIVITGGVALNSTLVDILESLMGLSIVRLKNPQIMGALGAAIFACDLR